MSTAGGRDESLDDYRRKRDFGRTPEPAPSRVPRDPGSRVFVVHRHQARSLHYDLRLEYDGALKSWAVPKGFSYATKEKRLAVRTEDHPLEYEDFHGVIPKGEYGAGTMTIWDRGIFELVGPKTWEQGMADGELKFVLRGRRLRGEWHLVRTKGGGERQEHWLLFKARDRYEGPDRETAVGNGLEGAPAGPLPDACGFMEAAAEVSAFDDPEWLFEMEFVGRRVMVHCAADELRCDQASLPGRIALELRRLRAGQCVLDGVLVVTDEHGRPDADRLEAALAADGEGVVFYVQDLLHYDDFDLRPLPAVDRKGVLRALFPEGLRAVQFVDHVVGQGSALADVVTRAGLPGMLAKAAGSPYREGASDAWRRIPIMDRGAGDGGEVSVSAALATDGSRSSRVRFTNLGKVFWPAEGYTKGDLIHHYATVADVLLPYLHERPVHMNRFPDGIEGKSFYQRQWKEYMPPWLEKEEIHSRSKEEDLPYMLCSDRDTLLYLANLGSIDLHPWLSRRPDLDRPDWAVVDLDPKGAPFESVREIAVECVQLLTQIGIRPAIKTSGKEGLHVYVPVAPVYTYGQTTMFCEAVARVLARRLPEIATVERHVHNREGRVYVDYLQNRQGQTIVPPYVARPFPGGTVSTPLLAEELEDPGLHPSRFHLRTVPQRLETHGDLFRRALDDPQDLLPAIERLQEVWRE